jgi:hypothetical protein
MKPTERSTKTNFSTFNHTSRAANQQGQTHPLIRLFAQEETNKRAQQARCPTCVIKPVAHPYGPIVGTDTALTDTLATV